MRTIILGVCLCTAACGGQGLNSPTSPTSAAVANSPTSSPSATVAPVQTQAKGATQLPFNGSFTLETSAVVNCPPTCPPTTLRITGTEEGHATHLGRFTAESLDVVDIVTTRSTGTFNFTAANGDQLFTTTVGREDQFIPPNSSHVSFVATIVGGTGRFVAASGTFTAHHISSIDFAEATASGSGSFEGHIDLNK
ncbi:MAG: hypothetical protein ABI868_21790 [Acidobacteriota bacterium]